jgi:hypothetical protein
LHQANASFARTTEFMSLTLPLTEKKTDLSEELKALIQQSEERFTIVHCKHFTLFPTYARIWPTTYLIENDGSKKKLLHAINIAVSPAWQYFDMYSDYLHFTLVFERLSTGCSSFHMEEIIAESHAFISDEIQRNKSDVYMAVLHVK